MLSTLLSNVSFLIAVPTLYKRNAGTSETEAKECWLSIAIYHWRDVEEVW